MDNLDFLRAQIDTISTPLYSLPPDLHIFAPMITSMKKAEKVRQMLLKDREEDRPGQAFKTIVQLIRKGKKLSVIDVYTRLNVTRQTFYNWLSQPDKLTVEQVKRLARALDTDVRDLIIILYGC